MPCDIPPICEDPNTCNWCNPPMAEIDILKKKLEIAMNALDRLALHDCIDSYVYEVREQIAKLDGE